MIEPRTGDFAPIITHNLLILDDALSELHGGIAVLASLSKSAEFERFAYLAGKLSSDYRTAQTAFDAAWGAISGGVAPAGGAA